jgi:hypothetical protein
MKKSASNDGDRQQVANLAQLQTTLNVIPAYAWYTAPSGGLTFVNKRTGDYLGLPKDHPLRFGSTLACRGTPTSLCCIPTTKKSHAKLGQLVCARAKPLSLVNEFVTLKEITVGSSVAPNRSGRAMEPYCSGSG